MRIGGAAAVVFGVLIGAYLLAAWQGWDRCRALGWSAWECFTELHR